MTTTFFRLRLGYRSSLGGVLQSSLYRLVLGLLCVIACLLPCRSVAQSCGSVVTSPTVLESDLGPCSTDPAITVVGPASLDLNGFRISCNATTATGVLLQGLGPAVRNGTVSGCEVGVAIEGGLKAEVENITATSNVLGIANISGPLLGAPDRFDDNVAVANSDTGFWISNGVASGNHAINNGGHGFHLSGGTSAKGNAAHGNGGHGFEVAGSGKLKGNIATGNQLDGFNSGGLRAKFTKNQALGNDGNGFDVESGSLIRNCASGNGADGVLLRPVERSTVLGNRCSANGGAGVHVLEPSSGSPAVQIKKNTSQANGTVDMSDDTVGCGSNQWSDNLFGTSTDGCIE